MTVFSESTLPVLVFSVPAGHPKGDVPALGRLTVNEAQGADQWWTVWGCETNDLYTHTDSTGSGALFYEAESRTVQGGAAVASASGVNASPAGSTTNNIVRHTNLGTEYVSLLSTQATGGGSHLSHVGSFRVFVRCRISTLASNETVSVALEWGYGDFRNFTQNDAKTIPSTDVSQWRLLDLGIVTIPQLVTAQRWEGRIIAKTTSGGTDFDLDCLFLVPVDVASGEASAVSRVPTPTAFAGLDNFNGSAANLGGRTAEAGGNWTTTGDVTDWVLDGNGIVQRSQISDVANTGRYGTLDLNLAGVDATMSVSWTGSLGPAGGTWILKGPLVRFVDTGNWLMASVTHYSTGWVFEIRKRLASGAVSIPKTSTLSTLTSSGSGTIRIRVDSAGRYTATLVDDNGVTLATLSGQDADLATGGTLATGDAGIYQENTSTVAETTQVGYFRAAAYVADAVMYANQSLEIRHDKVVREDSSGVFSQGVSSYAGDFNKVPVTGREGRSVRYIVKASRNDPATSPDPNIDDITATLSYTPRYLSVPAPT